MTTATRDLALLALAAIRLLVPSVAGDLGSTQGTSTCHGNQPNTKESGREGTARDLQKFCARLVADAKFARYLRTTLIPDFRASGSEGYVEDFTTCARYVTPGRR